MQNKRLHLILLLFIIAASTSILVTNRAYQKTETLEKKIISLETELNNTKNQKIDYLETLEDQTQQISELNKTLTLTENTLKECQDMIIEYELNQTLLLEEIKFQEDVVELIRSGELEDILLAYGEKGRELRDLQNQYDSLLKEYETLKNECKN